MPERTASITATIVVQQAQMTIMPPTLPTLTQGMGMQQIQFTGMNGVPPLTWFALGLPPGLTFTASGILSGTPTTPGTYNVTFTAADAGV